jgi:hypothetical protein
MTAEAEKIAILAKTGDLGELHANEIVRQVSSLRKSSRITDTLFPRICVDFFRFLSPLTVAVRGWRALVPTCQRLGVVVLLLDELGLQLEREEYPAHWRSCQ